MYAPYKSSVVLTFLTEGDTQQTMVTLPVTADAKGNWKFPDTDAAVAGIKSRFDYSASELRKSTISLLDTLGR